MGVAERLICIVRTTTLCRSEDKWVSLNDNIMSLVRQNVEKIRVLNHTFKGWFVPSVVPIGFGLVDLSRLYFK